MTDIAEHNSYQKLWEDFGRDKGGSYADYKFKPTHRIGLSNFLRESQVIFFIAPQLEDVTLDVGCAAGRQVFRLAPHVKQAHGVDIAQSFVDAANVYKADHSVSNAHFVAAPSEKLPFPDSTFDVVSCLEVLEHVFDKDVALKELLRVLKPGGRLILSTPNLNSDGTLWGRFMRSIGKRTFTPMTVFSLEELADHGDSHVREFTMNSMKQWLTAFDMQTVGMQTTSFIDGPYIDTIMKFPLHVGPLRACIIWFEKVLSATRLPFGRNLVVKAIKAKS